MVSPAAALPRVPTAARGLLAGSIVAFVACLLAAELILGFSAPGHVTRVAVLCGMLVMSIAMAGFLHPDDLPSRGLHPAESSAAEQAYAGAPASVVAIEGRVEVNV